MLQRLHIQRRKMLQRHTWHCNQSCNGIMGYTEQMCSWRLLPTIDTVLLSAASW